MDLNYKKWKNSFFGNEDKMSIKEMGDYIILNSNHYVEEVYKKVYPEFYNLAFKICNIINNYFRDFNDFREPIYITSINFLYGLQKNYDCCFVKIGDVVVVYPEFSNPIKINLAKKWSDYNDAEYFPGVILDNNKDEFTVVSSVPDHINYMIPGSWYELIPVSKKSIYSIKKLLLNEEIGNLYNLCIFAKNDEVINFIQNKKDIITKIVNKKIRLDNGMYVSFNLDSKKEFCRNNIAIDVYNNKLEKECEIEGLYDKKYKNILNYKTCASEVLNLFDFEVDSIDETLKEEIKKREEEEKLFEKARIKREKIEKIEKLKLQEEEKEKKKVTIRNKISYYLDMLDTLNKNDEKLNVPQEVLLDWNNEENCYEIHDDFKDKLKFINLSIIDFNNVCVQGIDFRYCNPVSLNPQKVYNKSLYGCRFDVSYDDVKTFNKKICYIPNVNWDLDGVDLRSANIYYPENSINSERIIMPINVDKAIIDDKTILPKSLQDKLGNIDNQHEENIRKIIQYMNKNDISIDEIFNYNLVAKLEKKIGGKKK